MSVNRPAITAEVTYDANGLPTWAMADGSTVSRDDEDSLTITRPGHEPIQGRLWSGETHREAYDLILEAHALRNAAPVVFEDYTAAVTVEAEIDGQPVTLRATVRLRHGAPEVLYAVSAEVRDAGIGALCVRDMLFAAEVPECVIAAAETALVEAWPELEAA